MEIEIIENTCVIVIEIGGKIFYAHPKDNISAKSFISELNSRKLSLSMIDGGNSCKVAVLPFELSPSSKSFTVKPGDIILSNGKIAICYDETAVNATQLAEIGNTSKEKLLSVLGGENITVNFSLEWGE